MSQYANEKIKCSFCEKFFIPLYNPYWRYKKGISKHMYCSRKCYSLSIIGKKRIDVSKRLKGNKYRLNKPPGNSFHKVNEDFFKKINSELSAYWFGFLLADGSMKYNSSGYRVGLGSIDREHIVQFLKDIQSDGVIRKETYNKNPFYSVFINNKIFCTHLFKKGMIPDKTKNLIFPTCVPKKHMNHFIRGYWEGDGSYRVKGREFEAGVVGTFYFISKLAEILQQLCGLKTIRVDCHSNELYLFKKTKYQAMKICKFLYKNSTRYLERKHNKFLNYLNNIEKEE